MMKPKKKEDNLSGGSKPAYELLFDKDADIKRLTALKNQQADLIQRLKDKICPECNGEPALKECITCGERFCPFGEPLHFHHDGCPACYEHELEFENLQKQNAELKKENEEMKSLAGNMVRKRDEYIYELNQDKTHLSDKVKELQQRLERIEKGTKREIIDLQKYKDDEVHDDYEDMAELDGRIKEANYFLKLIKEAKKCEK